MTDKEKYAIRMAIYVLNQLAINKADQGPETLSLLREIQAEIKATEKAS